jgi:hypothetical protein
VARALNHDGDGPSSAQAALDANPRRAVAGVAAVPSRDGSTASADDDAIPPADDDATLTNLGSSLPPGSPPASVLQLPGSAPSNHPSPAAHAPGQQGPLASPLRRRRSEDTERDHASPPPQTA